MVERTGRASFSDSRCPRPAPNLAHERRSTTRVYLPPSGSKRPYVEGTGDEEDVLPSKCASCSRVGEPSLSSASHASSIPCEPLLEQRMGVSLGKSFFGVAPDGIVVRRVMALADDAAARGPGALEAPGFVPDGEPFVLPPRFVKVVTAPTTTLGEASEVPSTTSCMDVSRRTVSPPLLTIGPPPMSSAFQGLTMSQSCDIARSSLLKGLLAVIRVSQACVEWELASGALRVAETARADAEALLVESHRDIEKLAADLGMAKEHATSLENSLKAELAHRREVLL